ncbi:hypothetical protein ARMGADRAFT_552101 [Armillaria gallica]|uniref:Secreted protein n=1 Tax=Armillaria gallica TaxID=47427 RepID=A0A2H3CRR0_ARMGA|nr:hypothetical protein ARMGADRAFT_552101 [Armillaria gallica]
MTGTHSQSAITVISFPWFTAALHCRVIFSESPDQCLRSLWVWKTKAELRSLTQGRCTAIPNWSRDVRKTRCEQLEN